MSVTSPSDGPDQVTVHLPQDASAAGRARQATRDALHSWRLPAVLDSAVLAVSELVTNALVHGRPRISLRLRRDPGQLSMHVHDGEPATEMLSSTEADAESGRGLTIVRTLSDDVSVEDIEGDGKVVHAVFDSPEVARPPGE